MSALVVGAGECTIPRIIKAAKLSPAYDLLAGTSGNWTKIANGLDTPLALKKKIKSDILMDKLTDVDDILELILTNWVAEKSANAKLDSLTRILEENGMKDLATKVQDEFNPSSSPENSGAASGTPSSVASNIELVKKMKQIVKDNLAELIESTSLHAIVIAHLQTNGVLSKGDERKLNSIPNEYTRNKTFYDMLVAKLGRDDPSAYHTFLEAMKKENQTGVCSYLKLEQRLRPL